MECPEYPPVRKPPPLSYKRPSPGKSQIKFPSDYVIFMEIKTSNAFISVAESSSEEQFSSNGVTMDHKC